MSFENLSLISPILKALQEEGYTEPSPIQQQAITPILEGNDLLGCAKTGTGKTAAFGIPMLQILSQKKLDPKAKRIIRSLILTPTRELALQISESLKTYGRYLDLKTMVIFGGVGQDAQVKELARGIDILVATPGRLCDLINQGFINLNLVEIFTLDEADRMLDMGFINDVKKIAQYLPKKKQTLFFSATMPPEVTSIVDSLLVNPVKVSVSPVSSTVDAIEQSVYYVDKINKPNLLIHLLQDDAMKPVLVFTRTKHGANKVVRDLEKANILAMAIHGNKSQTARQLALSSFKEGSIRVLVATDIAARGIDIDSLAYVVNYDLPNIPETYVHRIGRTGRAGRSGIAISFCDFDEKDYLLDIQKLIKKVIPLIKDQPYPMAIFEPAPKVERGRIPRNAQGKPKDLTMNGEPKKANNAKKSYYKGQGAKSGSGSSGKKTGASYGKFGEKSGSSKGKSNKSGGKSKTYSKKG